MKNTKLTPWTRFVGSVTALVLIPFGTMPRVYAADQTWTGNTNQLWSTSTNWTTAVPSSADNVILPWVIPSGGSLITLGAGSLANSLSFKNAYSLTGGDLTLTTGGVRVDTGVVARVDSLLAGAVGLTKTGLGTLQMGNAGNTYTGTTTINEGVLSISDGAVLGADASAVVVNGSVTRGFGGGQLQLAGGYSSGVTLARGVSLTGTGPIVVNNVALQSVGANTITGAVTNGTGTLNTAVSSAAGRLTLGDVTLAGTAGTTFLTFGAGNGTGAGSYAVTGVLSGTGSIAKTAGGTLFLTPSSATGWTGTLQVSAGSVRVSDTAAFGASAAASAIDLNGGILELRTDSTAFASAKRVLLNNGGTLDLIADHAIGSTVLNQTVTFANFDYDESENLTFTSRNGYNIAFTAATAIGNGASGTTLTYNGNGLATFGGTLWGNTNTTARTLTLNGTGSTLLTGSVTASGALHELTKNGTGTVTVQGTSSTFTGDTNINNGTLVVTDFRSLNNNTAIINIGSNASNTNLTGSNNNGAGTLTIGSATTPSAAGLTTSKVINLAGSTNGATINASQPGTSPVIFNSAFTATGINAKTLTLGGTNTADNILNGAIVNNATGQTQTAANYGTGATTITLASVEGIIVGDAISGPNIPAATTITAVNTATKVVTISAATTAAITGTSTISTPNVQNPTSLAKTGSGTWVLAAANTYSGSTTISNGTLKLKANAATTSTVLGEGAGSTVVFNANTAAGTAGGTLELVGFSGSATTETLGALTPTAGAATVKLTANSVSPSATNLVFTSLGATAAASSVNFITTGSSGGVVTLTGQAATTATDLPGTANFRGHLYINGADFAAIDSSANVIAPVYGTTTGFVNAPASLTAGNHNLLTGSFTSGAVAISSLKTGSQTLTLSGNLTVNLGAILQSGGTATIQSNSGTARTIVGSAAGVNIAIRVDGESDVLNLGALGAPVNISSTTTAGLTKNGAGKLVIFGTNAQTGTTTINEGTVQLNGTLARLSANGGTAAALVIRQGATLELNGVTTANAVFNNNLDGAGVITNVNASPATFTLNGGGTWAGTFDDGTGVLNVTKAGTTGAPTWSGLSNYTGVTTIAGTTGLVSVTNLANIGSDSSIGRGNATSDTTNAASLVFAGTTGGLSYTGTTSVSIDRLFTLNGSAAGSGAQIANNSANNSTLVFNKSNAISFGAGATVAQTLTLGGTSTGDSQINLQIVDNAALATSVSKTGAGLWILGNATNNYTGATTVSAGVLQAVTGTTLPTASNLVLAGGMFQSSGTFNRTLGTGSGQVNWTANASGGFSSSGSKLTVDLGSSPTWGSTAGFLGTGNLVLGSSASLGEVEMASGFVITQGAAASVNATTTAGNSTVNLTSGTTAGLTVGQVISGNPNIPANATIATIVSSTQFTLNSGTGVTAATGIATNIAAGGVRQIQVDDNTTTAADFATITGVISGTGNLTKTGAGTLQLFGANTYSGVTAVTSASTLTVNSLGNSATPGVGTSVGTSTDANLASNAVTLGSGGTTAAVLQYVGPGETSDRMIRINTTTGSTQIHADGAGPLVLTNVVNNMAAGSKALFLRGSNTQGNTISSVLTDNGGTLGISVDGGAMWILSGANTYTGSTDITAGALGAGSNTAFGTGSLRVRNGSLFAYGGDRTLSNPLADTSTTTAITSTYIGDYSLNLTSNWTHTNTTAGQTLTNSIVTGKTLTFGGDMQWDSITGNVTQTINGPGDTILNGSITTTNAFNVNLAYAGTGSLTLGGTASTNWSHPTTTGTFTISSGTVKLGANEVIPNGTGTGANGNVVISPATGVTATLDLNGKNETINGLTANSTGTTVITNSSATPVTFTVGDATVVGASSVTFGGGSGAYSITEPGGGTISLTKVGTGTANFTGTLGNTGLTTVSNGILNYNSASASTSVSVASGGTLNFKGGLSTPASLTSVSVAGGGFLSFASGLGQPVSNLTSLALGAGSGTTTLELDAGDTGTDTLTLPVGLVSAANAISLLIKDIDLSNTTSYTLLSAPDGGLTAGGATYTLNLAGYTGSSLTTTDTSIVLNTGTLNTSNVYWNGGASTTAWNTIVAGPPDLTNFSSDLAGTLTEATLPGKGQKVIFMADNLTGGAALTTTLEQPFKINALEFRASTTPADTPSSTAIGPGAITSNSLTLAPSSSADGINMQAGSTPSLTISAPVVAQGPQSWTVSDATQVLTVSGALGGSGNVTKLGAGRLTLSSATSGYTGAFAVNAGTAEITLATALSGVSATPGSGAAVSIGGTGAFYYNNATAGTVPNNLILAGGTLSAGGNGHTYSGAVNVQASTTSTINLRDLNSAVTTTTQRNITMSGALSGTGAINVDSIDTAGAGNQLTGNLVFNNAASTWSGALNMTRGGVFFQNVAGSGTATPYFGFNGVINFNQFGRVTYRNVDGATLNRTAAINFAAGAVGEFSIDNTNGSPASNYTVTQSGAVNLNAGSIVRVTLDTGSALNLTGGVVLNGNASLSTQGGTGATNLLTISTTGISGTGNLAINDEAGTWAVTSQRVAINAASTFVGNTTLNEGTLILGHKDALSSGSLTIAGSSSIQAGADLSAANAVANPLTLNNTLVVSGTNNLTFSGTFTGTGGNADRTLTNSLTSGTLVLSGTTINIGATGNTAGRTLTINGAGNTEITGQIVNNTAFANALLKGGAGTLTLSNSTNSYTGATTINAGTLKYGANSAITATSAVTVNANAASTTATLDLNGFSGTIGALTLGGTGQTASSASVVQTGAGTLTLGGNVATSATGSPTTTPIITGKLNLGAATRTFTVANSTGSAVDLDVQSVISGTGVGITKAGAGVLQLSNVNTYTGATTISPAAAASLGVILATANNALGTGAVTSVFTSGATTGQIQLSGGITLGNSSFTTSGLGSDGTTNGVIRSVSGSNIISGALNMTGGGGASTYRADTGASLTFNGNVGGVGANTARIINLVGGGNFVFNGNITNTNDATASTVGLDVGNTGTTTLSGVNTYTLATTVQTGGTLITGSTTALSASSALTLNAGGTLRLNGFSNSVPSITGAGTVENANASAANISVGAGNTTSALSTLLQDGTGGGSLGLTKIGTGTLTLSGTNTFTGKTVITNGTISVATVDATATASQPLGAHTDLDLGVASTSSGTLLYTGAAGTLGKNINALGNGSDTIQNSGSGLLTLSGTLTKAGTTLTLAGGASGIMVTGTIVGAPASSDLNVTGLVTLASANTFNGPAIIGSGATLNINHAGAIPTALTINGGTIDNTSGSAITLSSNPALNINSDFSFTGTNNLNLGTGAVTLNNNRIVTVSAGTLTVGGTISGNFNLTGTGGGTLVLTGASTYTGTTTVTGNSTLNVGGNGSLGDITSGTVVGSGSALVLNNVNYTDAEPLNITGTGTGGAGALVGGGTSSFAGPITLGGNATIGSGGGTFSLGGNIDKTGTVLTLAGGGIFNINGSIVGNTGSPNSDLVVDATTVNLNSANTYNGPTYIQNVGVLNANAASALPTANGRTAIIMNNTAGNVLNLGASQSIASLTGGANDAVTLGTNNLTIGAATGSTIYAGTISGTGGSLTKDLASTLTLAGASSYDGGTTVSGGTLNVTNTTGSATGTGNVTVDLGATLAGTGSIAPAANNSIYINGSFVVGDSSVAATASSFGLTTSGTGSTVMGAGSSMSFDLFSNIGDNSAVSTAADFVTLGGSLDLTAASTLIITNPNGLSGFALGDKWKLFSFASGSIVGAFTSINDSALALGVGLYGSVTTDGSGAYYVITNVPEPTRALLLMLGLLGIGLRRRRK